MKKNIVIIMLVLAVLSSCRPLEPKYTPGTYIGESEGYLSNIIVELSVDEYNVISVEILEHQETPLMAEIVFEKLPIKVIKHNSSNIDVVSGATYTSKSFLKAVEDALSKALIR